MHARQMALILNELFDPRAAYLFPQGVYPYEIRREGSMRIGYAWYLYDGKDEPFRTTLERSETYLLGLIDRVLASCGGDPGRVFLLGFSQGAYLGHFVAIRNAARFAGLVAIAGGRIKEEFVAESLAGSSRLPVLMLHGEKDEAVPLERARVMQEMLVRHGFPVELKAFDFGHEMRRDEIGAAREWLGTRIGSA
jgi:phospholipase/carboxylesterase